MNSKKLKKILSISIVSLVICLVIVTITLALIPKTFDNPLASGYKTITVYKQGRPQLYIFEANATDEGTKANNKVFTTIENLHKESLEDSLLSSILQGAGKFQTRVTTEKHNDIRTIAGISNNNSIMFTYLAPQTLKVNGTDYTVRTLGGEVTTVTYDMAVIILKNSDSFQECTMYLADSQTGKCDYQVKFIAHQDALYDYITDLELSYVA